MAKAFTNQAPMASLPYTEILIAFLCLFLFYHWNRNRNSLIINWPVLGMLPGLLWNLPRIHDHVSNLLKQTGGTFVFKGPWFSNLDFVFTSDPMNLHHIATKSFPNYPKGPEFSTIFEPYFGDGILGVDSDSWKFQRKMIHSFFKGTKFQLLLEKTVQEKVVNSLIPVLDHACMQKMEVNIEDVFERLTFDTICLMVLGHDPKCLSMELPTVPYEKAFNDMGKAMLFRHFVPKSFWKLLRWLQIGPEKNLTTASKVFDDFAYKCISSKRAKMEEMINNQHKETGFDFLATYIIQEEAIVKEADLVKSNNKFLRDMATSLVSAGRDSTSGALSWFFWLVATHESVQSKILEEIEGNLQQPNGSLSAKSVNKLIYLHAALCETLRLYPSLPINHKCSMQVLDTLPSGHHVKENTKILISYYAMGRMERVWGEDCCEFKPERWISKEGGIVHVPSYKFSSFGAGPRSCLGKEMSFIQMKMVAVAIIFNYSVRVVEDHLVLPGHSIGLRMKQGLKVRIAKRV